LLIPLLDLNAEPLFGLTANILPAPLSVLISFVLILGVDYLGLIVLRRYFFLNDTQFTWVRWQAICVGAAILGMVFYPLALLGYLTRFIAQVLAIPLLIFGFYHGFLSALKFAYRFLSRNFFKVLNIQKPIDFLEFVLCGLLFCYVALSISPVTEADSLDYHVGVALQILNSGSFPFSPEWFHSRLAGSGETLIALGLSIGAEQFGSLLQCSGIIGIFGIFRYGFKSTASWRVFCIFSVLSSPVLIAWVASPKPMLLPIGMTTAALMLTLTVFCSDENYTKRLQHNAFAVICLLIMTAAVTKMNFLMSGCVIGLIAFSLMLKKGNLQSAFLISFLMFFIIMMPPVLWKYLHYGGSLFDSFISPFPGGWIGTDEFEKMLRAYRDSQLTFPFSLLIPDGFGTITTVIGFGVIVAVTALLKIEEFLTKVLIGAAVSVTFLAIFIGQKNARFFMEPYIWLMLAVLIQGKPQSLILSKILFSGVVMQSIFTLGVLTMGIFTLSLGAFTNEQREATMRRSSMTYLEMKWVDSILPADAKVIISSRFMATAPRYAIASDWKSYVPKEHNEIVIYQELTAQKKPDFIIFSTGPDLPPNMDHCNGVIYAGPFRSQIATRNPFNAGNPYDVYIVKLSFPGASCNL
jgi:hypothetical protein